MENARIFWKQEFHDPGPVEGEEAWHLPYIMPDRVEMHGKRIEGAVFFPRGAHATLHEAVRVCYLWDRKTADGDFGGYQRRYFHIEQNAAGGYEVWTSRYARQNIDRYWWMRAPEGTSLGRAREMLGIVADLRRTIDQAKEMITFYEGHPNYAKCYAAGPKVAAAMAAIPDLEAQVRSLVDEANAILSANGVAEVT